MAIGDIVRRVVELARGTFAVKNLELVLDTGTTGASGAPATGGSGPLQVLGDTVFCYSILQNLLKNACEAAPEGSRVDIALQDSDPVTIAIRNTGAVPTDIRTRFFDKYVTAGKEGGTGIGTYSAKLLTEAQGGSIRLDVDDAQNRTEVTLTLPRVVR